jgi:hypothetical protein
MWLELRREMFNFSNHPRFSFGTYAPPPSFAFGNSELGAITNDATDVNAAVLPLRV